MDLSERARPTKHDGMTLVYNLAVVLTGGWAAARLDLTAPSELLGTAVVLAVAWTIYFKFAMIGRLADHPAYRDAAD